MSTYMTPATANQVFGFFVLIVICLTCNFVAVHRVLAQLGRKIDRLLDPEEKQ